MPQNRKSIPILAVCPGEGMVFSVLPGKGMGEKKLNQKGHWPTWLKLICWIAGILVIFLIAISIITAAIQKKIRQQLLDLSPQAQVSLLSIHVSLFTASLSMNDLSIDLIPDSSHRQHLHSFRFAHIYITGIDYFKLVSSKKLQMNSLRLEKGEIKLDKFLLSEKKPFPAGILARLPFEHIAINHIECAEAILSMHSGEVTPLHMKAAISMEGVTLNDFKKITVTDSVHVASFTCQLSDLSYFIPDSYHGIHIKKLVIDSKTEILRIDSFRLIPKYKKFEFGEKIGHQADRIEAAIVKIELTRPDFRQLLHEKLIAKKILLTECKIVVFRDRRLPRDLKTQPLPVASLYKLPLGIRVDSFKIIHSSVAYEEFPKEGMQSSTLKIEKLNMTLTPLVNLPECDRSSTHSRHMDLNVTASIMGSGSVNASIYLPVNPGKDYFIKGAIKNLDLISLKQCAENLGKIRIESGMLDNLDFQFALTEEKATGKIVGEYHHLIIDKLKEGKKNAGRIARLRSFALKTFIIPKNKDKSMPESKRTGKIVYQRDPTRMFSYYMLHALLTGIKSSFSLGFLLPG